MLRLLRVFLRFGSYLKANHISSFTVCGKTLISTNENLNHINNNTWSLFNDQSKLLLQVRQGASIVHQDNLLDIERFRNCLEKEESHLYQMLRGAVQN